MISNPAYQEWFATDQQVLGFLFSSLSREVLTQVAASRTAVEAWRAIEGMFASQTRARSLNVCLSLTTTRKGNMSISEYFGKMRSLGDEIAASGKPIDEEDMVAYILNGLDDDFEPVISALVAMIEPITMTDLYSQLLSFENRQALRGNGSSVTAANRGRGGQPTRGRGGRGRGAPRGRGNGGRGRGGTNQQRIDNRPVCQVCQKRGHVASDCWHRFDEDYVPEEKHVAAATPAYGVDTNWYLDTGATDHLTGELDKLTVREKYKGNDQIHAANGAGMEIKHIGHSVVSTPSRNLYLNNILHVPRVTKNLISAHRLAMDNFAFLEIHPKYFLIKDRATRNTILKGRCYRGLYPLPSSSAKQAFVITPSFSRWHSRLGHPSTPIVTRVLSTNNLPCLLSPIKSQFVMLVKRLKAISYHILGL